MKGISWRSEQGAAAVEFAVVAVLFLTIVFGIIELGILMFDKHILTNASREGARAGVVMRVPRVSDAEIVGKVEGYASDFMITFGPSSALSTTVSPPETARTGSLFGTELVVEVTYPFEFLVLSNFGLGPKTLRAETRMRME
jgi:Flp pilus assembly protein TadG